MTPLRPKRSLLVLDSLMSIKLMNPGEEAMTVLNSKHLPPISIKARIPLSAGRLGDTFTINKETQKPRKAGLDVFF